MLSVTQVLSPYAGYHGIDPSTLQAAQERGIIVHRLCAAMAEGLPVLSVPDVAAGYVGSFRRWLSAASAEIVLVEQYIEDRELGFFGHPDLVLRQKWDGGLAVVDLKTSRATRPTWACQVAAYRHLVRLELLEEPRRGYVLLLDPEGGMPRLVEYRDWRRDLSVFLACLTAYRYFGNATDKGGDADGQEEEDWD